MMKSHYLPPITYQELAQQLSKPGSEILASMTPEMAHLLHMAVGVAGEAGELLDAIKKHVIYNKPLDRENVVEEIGDVRFYLAGLMNQLAISETEAMRHNNDKLRSRYTTGGYTDQQAQDRKDKKDG